MKRSLSIPGVLEQSLEGVPSPVKKGEPLSTSTVRAIPRAPAWRWRGLRAAD